MMATVVMPAPARKGRGALRTLILAALATSALSPARAQTSSPVATPPLQPANSRTGLDVTPGGTPIVNIATPDARGTSHNVFTRLSVGKEGLIFNNSPATGTSVIGGMLLANPNLTGRRAASLILNEVTGGVRTALAGPMEVFGQRAALVIANPTGITCDGCGFINTGRVSLAAATLRFAADGAFSGVRIAGGGDVAVEGKGLLAGNVDYFDIIAAATHINASLYAKDLVIAGGSGTVDYAGRSASAESAAGRTGVAIDSSILGGMYANRIRLIGAGAGLGINLQGTVAALDGPLTITGGGAITIAAANASGDVTIDARGGPLTLSGQTYAGGTLAVSGRGIHQRGVLAGALGAVTFSAAGDVTLDPGSAVYAGLDAKGGLSSTSALRVDAVGTIDAGAATLAAGGVLHLDADKVLQSAAGRIAGSVVTIRASGSQTLAGAVSAVGDAALLSGAIDLTGSLRTGGTARLSATADLAIGGQIGADGALILSARDLALSGIAEARGTLTLDARTLRIAGTASTATDATVSATGAVEIAGTVSALGNLRLDAEGVRQGAGGRIAGGALAIQTRAGQTLAGAVSATGDATLLGGAIDLTGSLMVGGAVRLAATSDLSVRGQVGAHGATALSARELALSGIVKSLGTLTLQAETLGIAGQVSTARDATVSVARAVDITGTLSAAGALRLSGASLSTGTAAQLLAGTALALGTTGIIEQRGTLGAEVVTITADVLRNSGVMTAAGDFSVVVGSDVLQRGTLQAGRALAITGGSVELGGRTIGAADGVAIRADRLAFTGASDLQSGGMLDVAAIGDYATQGKIVALGRARIASAGALVQNAQVSGNGALMLVAGSTLDQTGTIAAIGSIGLSAAVLNNSGSVSGNADVVADATTTITSTGILQAAGALRLTAPVLKLGGTAATNTMLRIVGTDLSLSGSVTSLQGVDVTVDKLTLATAAVLRSGGAFRLDLDRLDNAGLIASSKDLAIVTASDLANPGQIAAGGTLRVASGRNLVSTGFFQSGGALDVGVVGAADLAGNIYVGGRASLAASTLRSTAAVSVQRDLAVSTTGDSLFAPASTTYAKGDLALSAAALSLQGILHGDARLDLHATGALALDGRANARGTTTIDAAARVSLSGALTSGGALTLKAPTIAIPGRILANDTVSITAGVDNLAISGTIQAAKDVALTAAARLRIGAEPPVSGGPISASGGGGLYTGGASSIDGSRGGPAAPLVAGTPPARLTLDLPSLDVGSAAAGSLASSGAVTLTADEIEIAGNVVAERDLTALAAHVMTVQGSAWSDASLTVQAGGLKLGTLASLAASGPVAVTVRDDFANGGTLASNGGALSLTAGGSFSNRGRLSAKTNLQAQAGGAFFSSGAVSAGTVRIDALDVTLGGATVGTGGVAISGRTLSLYAGSDTQSGSTLALTSSGATTLAGKMLAVGALSVAANGPLTLGATADLQAGGTATFRSLDALASAAGSKLAGNGALRLGGTSLALGGTLAGNATVDLSAAAAMTLSGATSALGDITLTAGSADIAGRVTSGGRLGLGSGATTLAASSTLQASGLLDLATGTLAASGTLRAGGNLMLAGTGDIRLAGTVAAGAMDARGQVPGTGDVSITAKGALDLAAASSAIGSVSLVGRDIGLGGTLVALRGLTVDAATLSTTGEARANGAVRLTASGDATLGGALTGLAGIDVTSGGALVQNAALASNTGLRLVAGGMLTHGGTSGALEDVSLGGASLSLAGTVRSNGLLSLTSGIGDIALLQGGKASAQRVDLRSANAVTLAGTLAATGSLTAASAGAFTVQATGMLQAGTTSAEGQVKSVGALTLTAGGKLTHAGAIVATGGVTLAAQHVSSTGTLSTGADLALVAGDATIGGSLTGLGAVSVRTTAGTLALNGTVEGRNLAVSAIGGDITLGSGSRVVAYGSGINGALTLASSGAITALGALSANNDVTLDAGTNVHIGADRAGTEAARALATLGAVTIRAGGGLINDGTVAAGRNVSLTAQNLTSVALSASEGIVADIARSITLRGTTSGRDVELAARGGDATVMRGAKVEAMGNVRLSTGGTLTNGGIIGAGSTMAGAPVGSISLTSAGALTSTGAIVANSGAVDLRGTSIALGGALDQGGGVYAARALTLAAPVVTLLDGAQVVANSDLSYTGNSLALGAGSLLQSNRNVAVALNGGSYRSRGSLVALGDVTVRVAGGRIENQAGGGIFAGGSGAAAGGGMLTLSADAIASAGSIVATASGAGVGGNATLTGTTLSIGGLLHADRTLGISAGSVSISGSVEAGAAIGWSVPVLTLASGGSLKSMADITLSGASLSNGGTIATTGALSIDTSGDLVSTGTLSAKGAIRLASGSGLTLGTGSQTWAGSTQATPAIAGGTIALRAATVASLGTLSATGGLDITANSVTVGGSSVANGDLTLASLSGGAPALTVNAGGTLATYLGEARLGSLSSLNLQGALIATNGSVSFTAGATGIGVNGRLAAGRDLTIATVGGGALAINGQLVAGNDIRLTNGTLAVAAGGLMQAGRDLVFTTRDAVTETGIIGVNGVGHDVSGMPISARIAGKLSAGRDLQMTLRGAAIADGSAQMIAGNDLSLTGSHLLLGARYVRAGVGTPAQLGVIAGRDLRLTTNTGPGGLILDGSAQAGNSLTVQASGAVRSTAAAQFVAGNDLSITGSALDLAGVNSGQNLVTLRTGGDLTLASATASNGRVTLFANAATVAGNGSITVRGGAGNTTAAGRDIGGTANLDIQTTGSFTNRGSLWSDGVMFLKSAGGNIVNDARGANGGITAATVVAQTDAGTFVNSAGAFKADNAGLFLGGDFNNSGTFAPSGNYWINAANIRNSGVLATSGNMTLQAAGALYNVGTIYAGNRLALTAGGALTNDYVGDDQGNGSHGLIMAQGNIAIAAHDVANQSATIQSLGGSAQFFLTGGRLVNQVKNLQISKPPSSNGRVKLFTRGELNESMTILYHQYMANGGCSPDRTWISCFSISNDGMKVVFYENRQMDGSSQEEFEVKREGVGASIVLNSGGSAISAAVDLIINTNGGNLTNHNSLMLAGGNVDLSRAGRVDNIADLLVSGQANTIIPGAPTIIQAGGTVLITAAQFNNIANNLVGPDTFTANQKIEHAAPGRPAASVAPQTGSTGNSAAGSTSSASKAGGAPVVVAGSAALVHSGDTVLTGQGRGRGASGVVAVDGSRVVAGARGGNSVLVGGEIGASAAPMAAGTGSSLIAVSGGAVDGRLRADAGTAFVSAAAAFGGTPSGPGNTAAITTVMAGNVAEGGLRLPLPQGTTARTAAIIDGHAGGMLPGASAVVPGLVTELNDVAAPALGRQTFDAGAIVTSPSLAIADANGVGPMQGAVLSGTRRGASAIVPALVAALDGVGAPTLADQRFGSFLGGVLASFNLTGSAPSLFTYKDNPASAYLFSSNAALSSAAALYDSKWFFDRVAPDRATTYARLGDGFFEALLVSRQVQAQSGRAQLSDFGSALDQYQGLLRNAEKARAGLGLQLGVALTAGQVAALTAPMVWYVRSNVEGRHVLVPVVYLAANDAKAISRGALVAGSNVVITATGGITNSGTLRGTDIVALAAQGGDIVNASGATIAGGSVSAKAVRDILLAGGSSIRADTNLTFQAGRDIVTTTISGTSRGVTATHRNNRHWSNGSTTTEHVAGAIIAAGRDLTMQAGGDISFKAATLSAGGAARLTAMGDLSLGGTSATTTTNLAERTGKHTNTQSTATSTAFVGTTVTAAGPVTLAAGADLTITGSTVKTTDQAAGGITLYGGQGIAMVSAKETATLDQRAQTGKKSSTTTSATSTTNRLSSIDAAGGISIASPGMVRIEGATVTAAGVLALDAGSLSLAGVVDTIDTRVDTSTKKSGLFSSTTRRSSTTNHDETAVASTLSGNAGLVTTRDGVTITGANLVGVNGLSLVAGGPVTIGSLAITDSGQSSSSVKKSGFSLGGGGLFAGVARTSTTGSATSTTHAGSVVGTAGGNLSIIADGRLSITGSQVAAGGQALLQGGSVTIANALDVRDSTQTTRTSSVGVSLGVQSQLLQSAGNLAGMAGVASSTANDRVAAVAGLGTGMAAANTYDAGKGLARTLTSGSGNPGVSVAATFGISRSRASNATHDETVVASAVNGRDVQIVATDAGAAGTIEARGSTITAAHDLTLAAKGAITLAAATGTDRYGGTARSSGFTLGVSSQLGLDKGSLGKLSPTVSVGGSSSRSHYTDTHVTNRETVLTAGGTATLTTPGALVLDGALVRGGHVAGDVGSLSIASRQDRGSYRSNTQSASAGASYALGTGQVSVSGNLSSGRQSGEFASVAGQAGIYAGDGGHAIRVDGATSLSGGVIASTADRAKNSLVTGTLHASDLNNYETWRARQSSLGGGIGNIGARGDGSASSDGGTPLSGMSIKGLGTVTAAPPMAMGASGDRSGTTRSAIAGGTITISFGDAASQRVADTISRATGSENAGALTQQFTDAKRREIADGFQAARTLSTETNAFLGTQSAKADQWVKDHPKDDPRSSPYATWGAGGSGRLVLTALNGAAGSDAGGSLTSLVRGAAVTVLQGLATGKVKELADKLRSEEARAALQGLVGCAGGAARGPGGCTSGAMGAAAGVVLNNLLAALEPGEAGDSILIDAQGERVRRYTQQEQQSRSNLAGTMVAAIAQAAGLNAPAAALAAQVETQNNSVGIVRGRGGPVTICTAGEQDCAGARPFAAWKSGTSAEREHWKAFATQYPDASDEEIAAAMRRYYAAAATSLRDPGGPKLTEAQAIAQTRQEVAARKSVADRIHAAIATDPGRRTELEGPGSAERDRLVRIAITDPGLASALIGQSQATRDVVYNDIATGRGATVAGRAASAVLSSVLGEKAMLGLYLANASDRAGERKGFFDGAVQGGRDAVVAQERGAQRAADDEAARMRARGTPDPVVSAYLFKEYYNAAARRELGSGLLDQARFLGDYLSDPARKSGEVIDGLARSLDAALLDDRGALAHVKALRDDLVDFAGADVRRQAMTLGNGAGKIAVAVVEVAVSKGASAVGGRIVGAVAGKGGIAPSTATDALTATLPRGVPGATEIVVEKALVPVRVTETVHRVDPRDALLPNSSTTPLTEREARRLTGENKGLIYVLEGPKGNQAAQAFQAGTSGAFSDVKSRKGAVPALRYDNSSKNGVHHVKFDGIEKAADGTNILLIDAKTKLPIWNESTKNDVVKSFRRIESALYQNPGYKVMYEFPDEKSAAKAAEFIEQQGFEDVINVRVRQQ